jgi:hypothetical protein
VNTCYPVLFRGSELSVYPEALAEGLRQKRAIDCCEHYSRFIRGSELSVYPEALAEGLRHKRAID